MQEGRADVELKLASYSAEYLQLSYPLFHVLVMSTKGRALRVVQSTETGNGFLGWYKLKQELHPKVETKLLGNLMKLLALKLDEPGKLLEDVSEWERRLELYEQQSEDMVSDNLKRAVLLKALPETMRQLMQSRCTQGNYNEFRAELRDVIRTQKAWTDDGPQPMDWSIAGAFDKGKGKGKSKDKHGKGKSKKGEENGWSSSWSTSWNNDKTGKGSWKYEAGKGSGKKGEKKGKDKFGKKKGDKSWSSGTSNAPVNAVVEDTSSAGGAPASAVRAVQAMEPDMHTEWVLAVRALQINECKPGMLIDSGSEVHVCPPSFHPEASVKKTEEKRLASISGEPLEYFGKKTVHTSLCDNETSVSTAILFDVSNVTVPVLSLGKMVEDGYEFYFSKKHGSWMSEDVLDPDSRSIEFERTGRSFLLKEGQQPPTAPPSYYIRGAGEEEMNVVQGAEHQQIPQYAEYHGHHE